MNGDKTDMYIHINVALTRVGVTTVAVAKHYYIFRVCVSVSIVCVCVVCVRIVCVCSLCYCSMKANAP